MADGTQKTISKLRHMEEVCLYPKENDDSTFTEITYLQSTYRKFQNQNIQAAVGFGNGGIALYHPKIEGSTAEERS